MFILFFSITLIFNVNKLIRFFLMRKLSLTCLKTATYRTFLRMFVEQVFFLDSFYIKYIYIYLNKPWKQTFSSLTAVSFYSKKLLLKMFDKIKMVMITYDEKSVFQINRISRLKKMFLFPYIKIYIK